MTSLIFKALRGVPHWNELPGETINDRMKLHTQLKKDAAIAVAPSLARKTRDGKRRIVDQVFCEHFAKESGWVGSLAKELAKKAR